MFLATHGVLRRSVAFVPPVFADNYSFEYDGVSDYLDLGNDSSLQISGNFSISIWIKYSAAFTGYAFSGCGNKYGIYIQSDLIILQHRNLSNAFRSVSSTSAFNDGNWHHVVGVNDGTNLLLYIDGVLNNSNALGGASITSTLDARIGGISTASGWEFLGNIDEPALFDYALTSTEVSNIYGLGVPTDISSLNPVGHWRAENGSWDGSKWTITDIGSGGNNAESVSMLEADRSTDVPLFDNKSFEYDGVSDYLEGTTTYSELDGQSKATFSAWIKPTATNLLGVILHAPINTSSSDSQFQVLIDNANRLRFNIQNTGTYIFSNTGVFTAGSYSHILVCYDGTLASADRGKIFIDGVDQTGAVNLNTTSFTNSIGSLYIAEHSQGFWNPFSGHIDEPSIYSGVDLRNDVATIYNNGIPNDLNNNGLTAPTTWIRSESSTWDGSKWTIDDENTSYQLESANMTLDSRTSDVPT